MLWKRFFLVLEVCLLVVGLLYFILGQPKPGIDDAEIFFVYGRNLASGQGIVFNVGGERVEGYSSTLWLLVVTLAYFLTASPEWLLLGFAICVLTLAVAGVWQTMDQENLITWRGAILLLWVFGSPGFMVWNTLALMDVGLWTGLFVLGLLLLFTRSAPLPFALFISALVLVRPEGMAWGVVFILCACLLRFSEFGIDEALKYARLTFGVYLVTLLGLLFFRLAYFGYPLPNTFYAKVSPDLSYNLSEGWKYLQLFVTDAPVVWLSLVFLWLGILACAWAWYTKQLKKPQRDFLVLAILLHTGLVLPVLTGGDHFPAARFYQPIWIFLVLPLLFFPTLFPTRLSFLSSPVLALIKFALFVSVALLMFALPKVSWQRLVLEAEANNKFRMVGEFTIAKDGELRAATLNEFFAGGELPTVGVISTGGFGLVYRGRTVDLVGLNNVEMAHAQGLRYGLKNHAAFNAEVFFKQYPDLVLIDCYDSRQAIQLETVWRGWAFDILGRVFATPKFWERYTPVIISNGTHWLLGHASQPFLYNLKRHPNLTVEILTPELTGVSSPTDLITK